MVWSEGAFLPDSGDVQFVINNAASNMKITIVDFILCILQFHYTGIVEHRLYAADVSLDLFQYAARRADFFADQLFAGFFS